MNEQQRGPDPVADSDRGTGTTQPERGHEGSNVVGRPAIEPAPRAFHERRESPEHEKQAVSRGEAVEKGGSFDGLETAGDDPGS